MCEKHLWTMDACVRLYLSISHVLRWQLLVYEIAVFSHLKKNQLDLVGFKYIIKSYKIIKLHNCINIYVYIDTKLLFFAK